MMQGEWREKYNAVIASFRWRGIKMRLLNERGRICQRCKKKAWPLEMHHKTYERLGEERDDDLELLCGKCHEAADEQRANEGRRRSEDALDTARYYGWLNAKYGEGYMPDEYDYEQFREWADSRDG